MTMQKEVVSLVRIQIGQLLEEWVFCRDNGKRDASGDAGRQGRAQQ